MDNFSKAPRPSSKHNPSSSYDIFSKPNSSFDSSAIRPPYSAWETLSETPFAPPALHLEDSTIINMDNPYSPYKLEADRTLAKLGEDSKACWDIALKDYKEKAESFRSTFGDFDSPRRKEAILRAARAFEISGSSKPSYSALCRVFSNMICDSMDIPKSFRPQVIMHDPKERPRVSVVTKKRVDKETDGLHSRACALENAPPGGIIELFPKSLKTKAGISNLFQTVAHETFHAYQDIIAEHKEYRINPTWGDTKRGFVYRHGKEHYIESSQDYEGYKKQPVERSAENFAVTITPVFENIVRSAEKYTHGRRHYVGNTLTAPQGNSPSRPAARGNLSPPKKSFELDIPNFLIKN